MITCYIGNVRDKRRLFLTPRAEAIVADNCDVLADFRLGGKVCFLLGDIPYGDMRIGEYLSYARALQTRLPLSAAKAKELLHGAGVRISPRRKMASLSRIAFRAVILAAKIDTAVREVWLDFDGVPYSLHAKREARRILKRLSRRYENVHAAFSDYRFLFRGSAHVTVASGGIHAGAVRSYSRKIGTSALKKVADRYGMPRTMLKRSKAILCDN
ncbi:MAG: hypothetical protein K2M95_04680 [Clostridiales bacterium]|nr:hypothetical protein [Clostridiales bacterium]